MMRLTSVLALTLFCLCVGAVSTIKRLYHMADLTSITFGKKFPHHGLMLLYWFTLHIEFDSQDFILPKDYDPTDGDYGCKTYANTQKLLPKIPRNTEDESYYIIGNLKNEAAKFPTYVNQDYYNAYCALEENANRDDTNRNRDRIIFRLKVLPSGLHLKEVYITQTAVTGLRLSHDLTYEISAQLLKEIRDITQHKVAILCPALKPKEEEAHGMFEDQNLAWFLTLADYDIYRRELCLSNTHCSDYTLGVGEECMSHLHCTPGSTEGEVCDWNPVRLKVSTTAQGYAVVNWANIPDTRVEDEGLTVALFQNDDSSDILAEKAVNDLASGSFPTNTTLNAGLQVRLLLKGSKQTETLWRGPELDGKNPTKIQGYDASIQLFTRDGLAYARFYVKKSFTNWKASFPSWYIGYIPIPEASYATYVYAKDLVQTTDHKFAELDVYEHFFNQKMAPRALLRFFDYQNKVRAQTKPWDD